MAFDIHIEHWPTIEAFTAYLQGVPRPAWCQGLTNHNTYRPDETQWYGRASVEGCMRTYIGKGWSAGPHLFLAAESPRPSDTGIWQMTPLGHRGIHAGACNADRLGIESVGDFDARPPSPAQYLLLLAVNRALLARWGMTPSSVNVHNECMVGRTCPGKYLTGAQIRADLGRDWPRPPIAPVSLPTDEFAAWGNIGLPEGAARSWAIPKAWLANKRLGKCVRGETYAASGRYSIAEFENGLITYLKARNVALVELF